ncbi:glycosyltransferase [Thioclava kandeliae]|uniref:Glycosyltransferase n=1 Tax=Thioclava kandeliae TaxID=3070818 RepID=A0ABV1SLK1_9RHOB
MTSLLSDELLVKDFPKLTVVMPVFNAGSFLAAALEGVLAQSFKNFELLVHDDGSEDGSLEVLRDYATRDSRIIVSSGNNQGVSAVSNRLVSKARGELIARMDADDICLPERFSRQVSYFESHPDVVVLGGACLLMDEFGRKISTTAPPRDHETIDEMHLRGLCAVDQPTVMFRKNAFLNVGGYDETYPTSEDLELWLRMAEIGRIENLSDVLLKYRIHSKSLSGAKQAEQREYSLRACQKAWMRRGISDCSIEFEYRPWRMENTRASKLEFYSSYAWRGWKNGYRDTWRHYTFKVMKLAPFSMETWKLLVIGALRRP